MKRILLCAIALSIFVALPLKAETYNLARFLEMVEQHSKDLELARQDLRLAGTSKKEATAGALPHLSANAGYNRNLSDQYMYVDMGAMSGDESAGASKLRINRDNEYSFNVTLSQTLFSGAVYNAIKAARQYQTLSDYSYDASHQNIITWAKKAFSQTLLLGVVWDVARASEANAHENYLDMKNAYENGLASEFDLLQAEVRYKETVPQTTSAERDYQVALVELKNLAGIPVSEEIALDGSLDGYPALPETTELQAVLKSRSDYNALLWEEKLRTTGISAERAAYFPSLTSSLTYAYSSQSDSWNFEDENNAYVFGLNLSIPIFTGGSTRARVQEAKIERDKTRISLEQTREDIDRDLKSTRLYLEEAYNRILSADATLKTAQKAFSIAEATARAGLTTQLQLKDSRVVLDQATVGYYSAICEYLTAYFDWQYVTGTVVMDGI